MRCVKHAPPVREYAPDRFACPFPDALIAKDRLVFLHRKGQDNPGDDPNAQRLAQNDGYAFAIDDLQVPAVKANTGSLVRGEIVAYLAAQVVDVLAKLRVDGLRLLELPLHPGHEKYVANVPHGLFLPRFQVMWDSPFTS